MGRPTSADGGGETDGACLQTTSAALIGLPSGPKSRLSSRVVRRRIGAADTCGSFLRTHHHHNRRRIQECENEFDGLLTPQAVPAGLQASAPVDPLNLREQEPRVVARRRLAITRSGGSSSSNMNRSAAIMPTSAFRSSSLITPLTRASFLLLLLNCTILFVTLSPMQQQITATAVENQRHQHHAHSRNLNDHLSHHEQRQQQQHIKHQPNSRHLLAHSSEESRRRQPVSQQHLLDNEIASHQFRSLDQALRKRHGEHERRAHGYAFNSPVAPGARRRHPRPPSAPGAQRPRHAKNLMPARRPASGNLFEQASKFASENELQPNSYESSQFRSRDKSDDEDDDDDDDNDDDDDDEHEEEEDDDKDDDEDEDEDDDADDFNLVDFAGAGAGRAKAGAVDADDETDGEEDERDEAEVDDDDFLADSLEGSVRARPRLTARTRYHSRPRWFGQRASIRRLAAIFSHPLHPADQHKLGAQNGQQRQEASRIHEPVPRHHSGASRQASARVPYQAPVVVSISDNSFVSASPVVTATTSAAAAAAGSPEPTSQESASAEFRDANPITSSESKATTSTTATTTASGGSVVNVYQNGGPNLEEAIGRGGRNSLDLDDNYNNIGDVALAEPQPERISAKGRPSRVPASLSDEHKYVIEDPGPRRASERLKSEEEIERRSKPEAHNTRPQFVDPEKTIDRGGDKRVEFTGNGSSSTTSKPSLMQWSTPDAEALSALVEDDDDDDEQDEDADHLNDIDLDEEDEAAANNELGSKSGRDFGNLASQFEGREPSQRHMEDMVAHKTAAGAVSTGKYSNLIVSPQNELPSSGKRRYWHNPQPHLASIRVVQGDPNDYQQQGGLNSAIIAILFGVGATGVLVMIVGAKMRSIRERMAYKGRRRSLVPDTDFLINTIPI